MTVGAIALLFALGYVVMFLAYRNANNPIQPTPQEAPVTTTVNDLIAKLNAQTAALRTPRKPATIAPHVMDALTDPTHKFHPNRQEATVTITDTLIDEPEHDWASYDSSDIHQRTTEWEAQARPTVIQHFTPKRKPITANQLAQANAALESVMPGVKLSATMRQHTAHKHLVDFVGADAANKIMAGE